MDNLLREHFYALAYFAGEMDEQGQYGYDRGDAPGHHAHHVPYMRQHGI